MSVKNWTNVQTGLQGYNHYPPEWGIATQTAGFPEDYLREQFSIVKDDTREKPVVLHVQNSTGLTYTCSRTRQIQSRVNFSETLKGYYYEGGLEQYAGHVPFLEPRSMNSLTREAATQLFKSINGNTVNVLAMLGEGPETVVMLSKIVKYAIGFKKRLPRTISRWFSTYSERTIEGLRVVDGNGLKFFRVGRNWVRIPPGSPLLRVQTKYSDFPKGAADALLTFDYGIRPLIGDFFGLAQVLSENIGQQTLYAKGSAKDTDRDQTFSTNGPWGSSRPFQVERFSETRVKLLAEYWIKDPQRHMLSALGITNPIAAGWELIPFSHVVDLLLPVGNWLQMLDSLQGIDGWAQLCYKKYQSNTYEPMSGHGFMQQSIEERSRQPPMRLEILLGMNCGFPEPKPSQSVRSLMDQLATLKALH